MKLLVLTPTLGRSAWLPETLASVAALGARVRHVLVCPGGVAEAVRRAAPPAEVVVDDRPGVYAALNRGRRVGGDWDAFTWLNDDDAFVPAGMAGALDLAARDRIVYGRVDYCDARGADLGPLPVEAQPARLAGLFAAGVPALSQQGTIVGREVAEDLGDLDERYRVAADFDYWARGLKAGAGFIHLPQLVARYRLRPGQVSGDTGLAATEIADSARRHFPGGGGGTAARLGFRLRHAPDLVRRRRLTGCWSSAALYRRAARTEVMP